MSLGLVELAPYWVRSEWWPDGTAPYRREYRRTTMPFFRYGTFDLMAPAYDLRAPAWGGQSVSGGWLDETHVKLECEIEIDASSLHAISDWLKDPLRGVASVEALYKTYCDPILTPEQIRELMA